MAKKTTPPVEIEDVKHKECLEKKTRNKRLPLQIIVKGKMSIEQMLGILDSIIDYAEKQKLKLHIKSEPFQTLMDKEQVVEFANWLDKLTPIQRISVWSKNGEGKGLFNMDNEQLFEKFNKETNKNK